MARRLRSTIHARDDAGLVVTYPAGTVLPSDVEAEVAEAWAGIDDGPLEPDDEAADPAADETGSPAAGDPQTPAGPQEPPRSGRAASRAAWAAYAAAIGVAVDEHASRDDIIDAVDAAKA